MNITELQTGDCFKWEHCHYYIALTNWYGKIEVYGSPALAGKSGLCFFSVRGTVVEIITEAEFIEIEKQNEGL